MLDASASALRQVRLSDGTVRTLFGRGLFETRFESKGLEFHQRLREGFLKIVEANPQRCVLIDAVGSLDEVEARVWQAVQDRLL